MGRPKNATVRGDGFRMYQWPGGDTPLNRKYNAVEPADLLSVTSIRTLNGEPWQLVNWKVSNVVNLAMGVRRVTQIGPKGGVSEKYVKDGPFPGEFVQRMLDAEGRQSDLDDNRKWLRSTADEPRDIAAVRGSIVHKMIEMRLPMEVIDEDVIRKHFARQWAEERRKVKPDVIADDINFVTNAMLQYHDMRATIPFVILAQEPQVFNLTVGYGGSADAMIWFLGHFERRGDEVVFIPLPGYDPATEAGRAALDWTQKRADAGKITLEDVEAVGGTLAVGDWKTAKGVYTNHVTQTTAYMAGEFVASGALIDERLTDLLIAANLGMVIHIRPDHWEVDWFEFRDDVLRGFLGSVAHARLLALHSKPQGLFFHSMSGSAPGTEGSDIVDDSE